MKTVIIAEKPSVASDLARVLGGAGQGRKGDGFIEHGNMVFTWCFGHLVGQCQPEDYKSAWKSWNFAELPMVPDQFRTKPNDSKARKQLKTIATLVKSAAEIVNACDAGREGELIFWMAMRQNGWGKDLPAGEPGPGNVTRMWLDSMTDSAIQNAWDNRASIGTPKYSQLAAAAYARSEADWLLGMNLTRGASMAFPKPSGVRVWSVGRVQTPVLAAVVSRDERRKAFQPKPFWTVDAIFGDYRATVRVPAFCDRLEDHKDRFMMAHHAQQVYELIVGKLGNAWEVTDKASPVREKPPRLFSLTSLQRHCAKVKGWTAQKTLEIAQKCYETEKTLTYPRTDSEYLPDDYGTTADGVMIKLVEGWAGKRGLLEFPRPTASSQQGNFNSAKVSDHFAIVPTGTLPSKRGGDTWELWQIVAGRFACAFGDTAEATKVQRTLTVTIESSDLVAHTFGKTYQKKGWIEIAEKLCGHRSKETVLPNSSGSDHATGAEVKSGKTEPPPHFREDTLLAVMEDVSRMDGSGFDDHDLKEALKDRGLGTPATRASIFETLIKRGFVVRKKRDLVATPAGCSLVTNLRKHQLDALTQPQLTAKWEQRLHAIEQGSGESHDKFLADLVTAIDQQIEQLRPLAEAAQPVTQTLEDLCPKSRQPMTDLGKHFTAPGFPNARLWKEVSGRTFTAAEYGELLAGETLGPLEFTSRKTKKPFQAKVSWNTAKSKIDFHF